MANDQPGIKRRVQDVLAATTVPQTMGALMLAANIPKTAAGEVSSALYKLRGQGLVKAIRGPSTSTKGPRFVRMYVWVVKAAPKRSEPVVANPLAGLGIFRM